MNRSSNIGVIGYRASDTSTINEKLFRVNDITNNISPASILGNTVVLDSLVHHQSPMYLMLNRTGSGKDIIIRSNDLGEIDIQNPNRKSYPTGDNMNRLCIGGRLHPLSHGYTAYSVYGNDFDVSSYQADNVTGNMEIITGIVKMNPYHKEASSQDIAFNSMNYPYTIDNECDQTYIGTYCMVAVATGSNYISYSSDGETWASAKVSEDNNNWIGVCYGNGVYVAIATNSNIYAYSTNARTWTTATISSTSRAWKSIVYASGVFVIICNDSGYTAYSQDGMSWTEVDTGSSHTWTDICYGNGRFVTIGYEGYVAVSTNGINWTTSQPIASAQWSAVCYGNGYFAAVASDSSLCAYSRDGSTWETVTIATDITGFTDIIYTANLFVCCSLSGVFYSKGTPLIWTSTVTSVQCSILAYMNGKFIAVYPGNTTYMCSSNCKYWYSMTMDANREWTAVNGQSTFAVEFDNNHTGISSDKTDVNGVSSMITLAEEYSDLVYYIHYAWVDRIADNSSRYNILTRKIDCTGSTPTIKNLVYMTTSISNGNIAHPMLMKDLDGNIHCAFLYSDSTYVKYYYLKRTSSTDTTWTWSGESASITIDSLTSMTNCTYNNKQNQLDYNSSQMVIVNNSGNCLQYVKVQE